MRYWVVLIVFLLACGELPKPVVTYPKPPSTDQAELDKLKAEMEAAREAAYRLALQQEAEEGRKKAAYVKPPDPVASTSTSAEPTKRTPPRTSVQKVQCPKPGMLPAKVGYDQIRYVDPKEMAVGVPLLIQVDIGDPTTISKLDPLKISTQTMNIEKSTYYLIGLESEFPGNFLVEPAPGQDQKQHKAKTGSTAHWQYRVIPLKGGDDLRLFYTLRIFSENDSAGTVVQIQPITVKVNYIWTKSYVFKLNSWVKDYFGWATVITGISAMITAWWKKNISKTVPVSE